MTVSPSLSPANAGYMSSLLAQSKQNIELEKNLQAKNVTPTVEQNNKKTNNAEVLNALALVGNLALSGLLLHKFKNIQEIAKDDNVAKLQSEFNKALEQIKQLIEKINEAPEKSSSIPDDIKSFITKVEDFILNSKPIEENATRVDELSNMPFRLLDEIKFVNGKAVLKSKPDEIVSGNIVKKGDNGELIFMLFNNEGKITQSVKFNSNWDMIYKKEYTVDAEKNTRTTKIQRMGEPQRKLKTRVVKQNDKVVEARLVEMFIKPDGSPDKPIMYLEKKNGLMKMAVQTPVGKYKYVEKLNDEKPLIKEQEIPFEIKQKDNWVRFLFPPKD